jgi:hypothetical protein
MLCFVSTHCRSATSEAGEAMTGFQFSLTSCTYNLSASDSVFKAAMWAQQSRIEIRMSKQLLVELVVTKTEGTNTEHQTEDDIFKGEVTMLKLKE